MSNIEITKVNSPPSSEDYYIKRKKNGFESGRNKGYLIGIYKTKLLALRSIQRDQRKTNLYSDIYDLTQNKKLGFFIIIE